MSESSADDFEFLSRLGSGSFGTVFRVRRRVDDQVYVIKIIRIGELTHKEKGEAINEVRLLADIDSSFIVQYFDSFIDQESLHIVMEYCNRGDLNMLLRKAKEKEVQSLKEDLTWNISLQILLGLYCLHQKKILHRDLKTANVFLQKDASQRFFAVKIGDLGVAKLLETSTAFAQTIVGTPYYLSPELCADQPYGDRSDCWALGVILYECCTLTRPFTAGNQCALIMKIIQAQVEPVPESHASPQLSALITWLLQKDWRERPSTRELLCDEFIRDKLSEHQLQLPNELLDEPTMDFLTSCVGGGERGEGVLGGEWDDGAAAGESGLEGEEAAEGGGDGWSPMAAGSLDKAPSRTAINAKRPSTNPEAKRSGAGGGPGPGRVAVPLVSATLTKVPVRGDRVRGPVHARRQLSSKVLTRHQVQVAGRSSGGVQSASSQGASCRDAQPSLSVQGTPLKSTKLEGSSPPPPPMLSRRAEEKEPSSRIVATIEPDQDSAKSAAMKEDKLGQIVDAKESISPENIEADSKDYSAGSGAGADADTDIKGYYIHTQLSASGTTDSPIYEEDFEEEFVDEDYDDEPQSFMNATTTTTTKTIRMSEDDTVLYQTSLKDEALQMGVGAVDDQPSLQQSITIPRLLITPLWAIRDQPSTARPSHRDGEAKMDALMSPRRGADEEASSSKLRQRDDKEEEKKRDDSEGEEGEDDDEDDDEGRQEEELLREEKERIRTLQLWIDDIRGTLLRTLGERLFESIYGIVVKILTSNKTFLTGLDETDGVLKDIHTQLNGHLQTSLEGACRVVLQIKTLIALEGEINTAVDTFLSKP